MKLTNHPADEFDVYITWTNNLRNLTEYHDNIIIWIILSE